MLKRYIRNNYYQKGRSQKLNAKRSRREFGRIWMRHILRAKTKRLILKNGRTSLGRRSKLGKVSLGRKESLESLSHL